MPVTVTTGTREEPFEIPLSEGETAQWVVFIDGEKKHFLSAHAYTIWAGESLMLPLAPKLAANLPAGFLAMRTESEGEEEEDEDSYDDFYEDTTLTTCANWASDDEEEY